MPNNNNQQNSQSFPNDVQNTEDPIPVLAIESESPPILQDQITTPIQTSNEDVKAQDENTDVGSAAPSVDIVMPPVITSQRKKFPGGKVIATILGLFLLVGGLGAGILLVDQNQNINEEAGYTDCMATCMRQIGDKEECEYVCGNGGSNDGPGDGTNKCTRDDACPPGQKCNPDGKCEVKDKPTDKSCRGKEDCPDGYACVGPSSEKATCVLASTIPTIAFCDGNTPGVPESIGQCCVPGGGTSWDYINGKPFDGDHWTTCAAGYECVQGEGCFKSGGGEGGTRPTPTPGPTRQPSPPATISASCQNLLAYDTNWKLYRPEQLSLLKPGQNLYFCVTGSASSGYFDKAKFTINGEQFSETTTKRPNSDDYCQLYTIKSGVSRHDVSAQIHHVTLGWK